MPRPTSASSALRGIMMLVAILGGLAVVAVLIVAFGDRRAPVASTAPVMTDEERRHLDDEGRRAQARADAVTPPEVASSPLDRARAIAVEVLPKGKLVEVTFDGDASTGDTVHVSWNGDGQWSESTLVSAAARHASAVIPKVLAACKDVSRVEVAALATLTDAYGKESREPVVAITLSRETSLQVTWPKFQPKNISRVMNGNRDRLTVHPSLKAAWSAFINER